MGLWACPLIALWPVLYRHLWEEFSAWDYCLQQWNASEYAPPWHFICSLGTVGEELHVLHSVSLCRCCKTAIFFPMFKSIRGNVCWSWVSFAVFKAYWCILVMSRFSSSFHSESSWDAAGRTPQQAAARQVGPVCQTLILLQLLCLYHAYHHSHCSCLLQTCG